MTALIICALVSSISAAIVGYNIGWCCGYWADMNETYGRLEAEIRAKIKLDEETK